MELIQNSLEKIVFSVSKEEIDNSGFDRIWDKIRNKYDVGDFDIISIAADQNDEAVFFIELAPKKLE